MKKVKTKKREYIHLNNKEMNMLRKVLELKERTCFYCGEKIDFRTKYAIFNKPTRIVCNSELCLMGAINEE